MTGGVSGRLRTAARSFAANARSPQLRRIQLGFAGACTAEWGFTVVLSVYAFQHGGAAAVGLISLLRMLPSAALAPFASALADRWRRDVVLTIVSSLRCLVAVGIAVLVEENAATAAVYALTIVSTAAGLLYRPVNSALMPLLCRTPAELAYANLVRGLLDSLSTLIGPAVTGALLARGGTAPGFVAVGAISALSAVTTLGLTVEEPEHGPSGGSVTRGLLAGARTTWQLPPLRVLFVLIAAQTLTRGAVAVFSVLVAIDLLDLGDPGVGTLTAALGAGAVVGSLVASILVSNERLAAWFGIGVAMWGAPLIALAAFPGVGAALVLFALLGVGNALVDVGVFTLIGRLAPERVLARVFGLVECVGALAVGAGSVLAAGVAGGTSLRVALAALGAVGPVLVLLSWRGLRRLDAVMVVRGEDMALLRTVRALDPLPLPALEQLATALEPRHVPAGGQLFAQGDAGDGCFVIESGVAEVIGDGHRIVTLGPSELVGEIALLRHVPRTATVRAVTDLDVRRLDGERFVDVVTGWERSRVAAGHQVDQLLDRYSPEPPSVE